VMLVAGAKRGRQIDFGGGEGGMGHGTHSLEGID